MTLTKAFGRKSPRLISLALVATLAFPMLAMTAGCGSKSTDNTTVSSGPSSSGPAPGGPMTAQPPMGQTPHQGMSTKQKVVLLAGAALLYYLYKKHQAAQQQTNVGAPQGQLYQSKNGGIYYRNAQHQPVWVTAPSGGVSVPADQVQRYAPDYSRFQNTPVPAAPAGSQTQSATDFDPSLTSPGSN